MSVISACYIGKCSGLYEGCKVCVLQLPAVDSNRSRVSRLLLVSQGVLHQPQEAVGGAGHQAGLLGVSWPVVVGEMCEAHLLSQLKTGYLRLLVSGRRSLVQVRRGFVLIG